MIALMRDNGVSQMPVLAAAGERLVGIIAEAICSTTWSRARAGSTRRSTTWSNRDYATVTPATRIHLLRNILNDAKMVVVEERDAIVGVITKIDLIEYLAERSAR